MHVFHMSTARLVVGLRPAGLDELTAGANDRRYQRLAGTALLGMREPCRAGTCIPARTVDAVGDVQPVEGLTAKLGQTPVVLPTV